MCQYVLYIVIFGDSKNLRTSSGSMAFALPPRGFLVKNWKVLAPMDSAVLPISKYPFATERWQPILSIPTL